MHASNRNTTLNENDIVYLKMSKILEGWVDLYKEDIYIGTIPFKEFKNNFRYDNLNFS